MLEKRKVGVCGSSKGLSRAAVAFCKAVGRRLAEGNEVCLVTGGTKQRQGVKKKDYAVEWHVASSAKEVLDARGLTVDGRIATVPREEASGTLGFRIGSPPWTVRGKTGEARRFAFIHGLDALMAIGGGNGTDQELALALELGIPVLPVPVFPGRGPERPAGARKYWQAYRPELLPALTIDEARARRWERPVARSTAAFEALAREMVDTFLRSLRKRCFVIMPYSDRRATLYERVIGPALQLLGDDAVNLRYLGLHGDAARHVDEGIRNCQYVIAVLDDMRRNVLYELGLAHGRGKPAILMNRKGALERSDIPFDIFTQTRLEYERVDDALRDRLVKVLKEQMHRR